MYQILKIRVTALRIGVIATVVDSSNLTGVETYVVELLRNTPDELRSSMVVFCHKNAESLMRSVCYQMTLVVSPFSSRIITDQLWVPKKVRSFNLSLIYNASLSYPWFGYGSVPFFFILHDATPWRYPETVSRGMKFYYLPQIERELRAKELKGIVTPSKSSRTDIAHYCSVDENIIYPIPLGVDHTVFRPFPNTAKRSRIENLGKYLLLVGTLEPRKNLRITINAFEEVSRIYPELKLVVVGRQGWQTNLEVPKAIEKQVVFTGYVSRQELVSLYSHAEALVFPSLYEGFGFPIIEAMSCGTPVITSNVSSMPEVGGEACIYVDPKESDDIARKICALLNDKSLQTEFVAKGILRSARFSWSNTAEETWRLLNDSINRREAKQV